MSPGSLVFLVGTNIFIFFQDTVLFLGLNINTGNLFFTQHFEATNPQLHHFLLVPQAWTLGIEMSFYLIAPFLVRRSIRVIIPVILLSLLIKVFLYRAGLNFDPWNYRFFPAELQFFLLGNISYVLYRKIRTLKINQWLLYLFFFFILGFTVFFDFIPLHKKNALYLVSFFVALPFIFYMSKNNKYDTYIGELSYPVYISHLFVLQLLTILKVVKIPNFGLILTISSIAFSILLNEFVSKKIEVLRQRRIKKNSVLPSLVNLK
jgi:peptidoglycan/LPS O-acetylase OafA/YrhL